MYRIVGKTRLIPTRSLLAVLLASFAPAAATTESLSQPVASAVTVSVVGYFA